MEEIKLLHVQTGQVIAEQVNNAYTFWTRWKGLMFTKHLPEKTGLHLSPCTSIHTFFMKYSIDILYLNREMKIVGVEESVAPGKIGKRFRGVHSVIELPAGTFNSNTVLEGHAVQLVDRDYE